MKLQFFEILLLVSILAVVLSSVGVTPDWKTQASVLSSIVVYTWCLNVVNLVFTGGALNGLGIRPRSLLGLPGILLATFLHRDWIHLLTNTVPFLILAWFIMLQGKGIREFAIVTLTIMLIGNLGTWLFGAENTIHIGASGVIFGYLGFLLFNDFFNPNVVSLLLAFFVAFLYGRLLLNVLQTKEGVSWQGHFFGFVGGMLAARFLVALKAIFPAF